MSVLNSEPRQVVSEGIAGAGLRTALHWAVAHAALAPSEHNAQPWTFDVVTSDAGRTGTISLRLDPDRCTHEVDPSGREAVLGCGAALLNLRLGLIGAGLLPEVLTCPEPAARDLLARVVVRAPTEEGPVSQRLRLAIPVRTTYRGVFDDAAVPSPATRSLLQAARAEGALAAPVRVQDREEIARLVRDSQQVLWERPSIRREAGRWARSSSAGRDGVPGYAYGQSPLRSWLNPTLARHGHLPWTGEEQSEATLDAAVLVVVASAHDDRERLLRAGAGMQRLLLTATADGLVTSYLNAPMHVPSTRARVGELVGAPCPQVMIRIGVGTATPPTPRRHVIDLLRTPPG